MKKNRKNEFGAKKGSDGRAPSILQKDFEYPCCYICLRTDKKLDKHEVFFGNTGNRDKSMEYGLWIYLCRDHHTGTNESVHLNPEVDKDLKRMAQSKAMKEYGWDTEKFIEVFGKNYL